MVNAVGNPPMTLLFQSRRKTAMKADVTEPLNQKPASLHSVQAKPQGYIWKSRRKPIVVARHQFDFNVTASG